MKVLMASGYPIRAYITQRAANDGLAKLRPGNKCIEEAYLGSIVDELKREAEVVGLDTSAYQSLLLIMLELIECKDDEEYTRLLNKLVFYIPFATRKRWEEMALEYLKDGGWEDEPPVEPVVEDTLFTNWQGIFRQSEIAR
jgi:hypothetical protein